ncbi:unnamed protein product, partial [Closterium sp. NIES-54]
VSGAARWESEVEKAEEVVMKTERSLQEINTNTCLLETATAADTAKIKEAHERWKELKDLALEIEKVRQDLLRLDDISGETRALARKVCLPLKSFEQLCSKVFTLQLISQVKLLTDSYTQAKLAITDSQDALVAVEGKVKAKESLVAYLQKLLTAGPIHSTVDFPTWRKEALSAVQDIESRLKTLMMQVAKLRDEKLLIEEAMDGTTVQDLEENMKTLLQQQKVFKLQIEEIEGDMQNSIREREVHKTKVAMCMTDIENLGAQHNKLRDQLLSLNSDMKNAQGGIAEARERISDVVKVMDSELLANAEEVDISVSDDMELDSSETLEPESEWKALLHRLSKLKHAKLSGRERKAFGERMSTLNMFKDRAASIVNSMKVLNEGISRAKSKVLMVNRDTYTRVRSSFQNLCRHLLPNKSVDLMQLGETVEDGIKIAFCNSPASQDSAPSWNKNLSQLSGGQQTLLSVALVLAIAQCSQNFVYLMDEVDAALDEENQSRVGALVQSELARKGQVLCVSHNRAFQTFADSVVQVSMDNGSKISYAQLDSGKRAKHMGS